MLHEEALPSTLQAWLTYCEHLHPKTIALGLGRVAAVAQRMGLGPRLTLGCPVITVAGTNGKGSTCAMLESILTQSGYRVGLYTSPHLVNFTERCRIAQQSVSDTALEPHFARVEAARAPSDGPEIALTYFEFTTLAILSCLGAAKLDAVILEVGLGGRLDATNIIDADCAVITSIDLDHTEFLGATREAIGREKAGILRAGRPCIVSDPMPPQSVLDHAQQIGADLWCLGRDYRFGGDAQQWSWSASSERGRRQYSGLAYPALRGANQLINAAGALAALEALRARLPVTAQGIRSGFAWVHLPARFEIRPGQPTIVLDVAHNPHAVAALVANLDAMPYYPRTHAVFGAMADKDIAGMLQKMQPLVDVWHVCDLPTPRAARAVDIAQQIIGQQVRATPTGVFVHESPKAALDAALSQCDPTDRILAFGSFFTIGGVLEETQKHR